MSSPSPAGWGSKHDIHVVETNYEEYALVATQISKSTGSSTMVLLYSMSAPGPPCHPLPRTPRDVLGGGISPTGERQHHLPSWGDPWDSWVGPSFVGTLALAGLPTPQSSVTPH